jgi:tRNA-specific 2-thiouridylase
MNHVIVALSGGVDSSVAAALLKEQGFKVSGVFMILWGDRNKFCSLESQRSAALVAKKLKIPFRILNLKAPFKKRVVDYFVQEYQKGRTPNPCVVCNQTIRFRLLLDKVKNLGGDFLATGHYVRSAKRKAQSEKCKEQSAKEHCKVLRARDKNKDQSYFLYTLTQSQLKNLIFPLGKYKKEKVIKLAKKFGLDKLVNQRESQEVCFVEKSLNDFLSTQVCSKSKSASCQSGEIKDVNTRKVVGQHQGLIFYTIGQRSGLGVGGGRPYYVTKKDLKTNILWVTANPKDKNLLRKSLIAQKISWISGQKPKFPLKVKAKIRYRHEPALARVVSLGSHLQVVFAQPQRAITPGQSVVFYQGEEMLGGGVIVS